MTVLTRSRSRAGRTLSTVLVFAMLLTVGAPLMASATWETGLTLELVSVDNNGLNYDRGSKGAAVSDGGRYVAFISGSELTEEDDNGYRDVFRRDLVTGVTELVSVSSSGVQGDDDSGDWGSEPVDISADGRYVAFDSRAGNLVPDDDTPNGSGERDVFVRDMVSGETTRVSGGSYGDQPWRGATEPSLDDAATKVAFRTAKDLVPEDDNGSRDIYVRNLATGDIVRVSVSSNGTQANGDSYEPCLSGDGRYVVFHSYADNLVADDDNGETDVFRHDLETGETVLVSQTTDGEQGDSYSRDAKVNHDGRYVVFRSRAILDPADTDSDNDGERDIYLRDIAAGTTTLITPPRVGGWEMQRGSKDADISGDGRFVVFVSGHDYAIDDKNGDADVYLYDVAVGTYTCMNRDANGTIPDQGDGLYEWATISSDGSAVAFDSWVSSLVPNDANGDRRDVFARKLRRAVPDGATRHAGVDRYETAVKVSQSTFPDGAETVIIATGANWPDAMCGSALAGAVAGPILLTRPGTLPDIVKAEITRLGADNAYILGGTGAVSASVEDALEAIISGEVNRLAGATRYGTARAIADHVIMLEGGLWDGTVLVATGGNFPDSLAGAPLASGLGWPIVLASPSTGDVYVPDDSGKAYILGGTGAVPAVTETTLKHGSLSNQDVVRLAGATRYDTAAMAAQVGVDNGLLWDGLGVATGQLFPDGLTGGAAVGLQRTVLLLTPSAALAPAAEKKLTDNKDSIDDIQVLGGTGAVSADVMTKIKAILGL